MPVQKLHAFCTQGFNIWPYVNSIYLKCAKKIKEKPILLLFFDFLVKLFKGLDAYVGVRNNLGTVGKKLVIFYLETSIKKRSWHQNSGKINTFIVAKGSKLESDWKIFNPLGTVGHPGLYQVCVRA